MMPTSCRARMVIPGAGCDGRDESMDGREWVPLPPPCRGSGSDIWRAELRGPPGFLCLCRVLSSSCTFPELVNVFRSSSGGYLRITTCWARDETRSVASDISLCYGGSDIHRSSPAPLLHSPGASYSDSRVSEQSTAYTKLPN